MSTDSIVAKLRQPCGICGAVGGQRFSFTPPVCWGCRAAPAPRSPGQPKKGRTATLPRISRAHYQKVAATAEARDCYLADVIEQLIDTL